MTLSADQSQCIKVSASCDQNRKSSRQRRVESFPPNSSSHRPTERQVMTAHDGEAMPPEQEQRRRLQQDGAQRMDKLAHHITDTGRLVLHETQLGLFVQHSKP